MNSINSNYSFRIQVQVYIHNWTYRVQRRVFNLSWARRSSANQTCKTKLRRDSKYLATAKHKGDHCAQIGYRRSNNYRSTSCPCEASSDPRTWELAAPTIDPTSSWLLPRSTAIGWLSEEDTMSSRHLWWGPPAPTFWDHWIMFLSTSCQSGAKQTTNLKSTNISFKILPFFLWYFWKHSLKMNI